MNEPIVAVSKNQIASYLYLCTLYFVTIGVLYLWGYWSTFNVNILEYLNLADVLKATAYPIATALILLAFGAAVGELLLVPTMRNIFGTPKKRSDEFFKILFLLYLPGTAALAVFGPVEKWAVLPILLAIPVQIIAARRGFLDKLIPHESTRYIMTMILAMLPPLAYGHGRLDANEIQTSSAFTYVLSDFPGTGVTSGITPSERLRFLGHAGDNFFLLDPVKNTLTIMRLDSGKAFVFKQFEQPHPKPKVTPSPSKDHAVPGKPIAADQIKR